MDYYPGAKVELKANQLQSSKTQLPYGPYSLDFCEPKEIVGTIENLGEILTGDVIKNSPYQIFILEEAKCRVLCRRTYNAASRKKFQSRIDDEYTVNWSLDNLPAATVVMASDEKGRPRKEYELGFPLGYKVNHERFINNHVTMNILYHNKPAEEEGVDPNDIPARIVGFEVKAKSILHKWGTNEVTPLTCGPDAQKHQIQPQRIDTDKDVEVTWTYDVFWQYSEIEWASRWDTYLLVKNENILWFSIANVFMISLFLSAVLAMIMLRTIHQDFARYNQLESSDESQEETGWKLVHGDVFRPPTNPILFAVTVGAGSQVYCMSAVTILFALMGILSPASRGSLLMALIMSYMFFGIIAGKVAAKIYKSFVLYGFGQSPGWKRLTLFTAFLYQGFVFVLIFILNLFVWSKGSSAAIPFWALLLLLLVWFGMSVPSTAIGVYLGQRPPVVDPPVRTNQIPRQIPEQLWYQKPVPHILMGGMMPFAAIFIKLYFIFTSIWQHQLYYAFGFLFLVFIIMTVMSAEIAIVLMYFQLCGEDYQWWWRSILTPGCSAFYMFLYSIFYYFSKSEIDDGVSTLLFFTYTLIMCLVVFLMTGAVGFYGCDYFARAIYASIKVD